MWWLVMDVVSIEIINDYEKWIYKMTFLNLISLVSTKQVIVSFSLKVVALLVAKSTLVHESWHIGTLSQHWHIVSPSILSINQKMNHCAKKPSFDCADICSCSWSGLETISMVSRYYYPCSFVTLPSNLNFLGCLVNYILYEDFYGSKIESPCISCNYFNHWTDHPIERSLCCHCHLCHNHSSFNSPCHQIGFYDY